MHSHTSQVSDKNEAIWNAQNSYSQLLDQVSDYRLSIVRITKDLKETQSTLLSHFKKEEGLEGSAHRTTKLPKNEKVFGDKNDKEREALGKQFQLIGQELRRMTGKNNAFAIQVGKFNDTDAYNAFCNSDIGDCESYTYSLNNLSYFWEWDDINEESESQKKAIYSRQRIDSEKLGDLAVLMGAGMLINRLVSAFDVLAIKKKEGDFFSFNVEKDKNKTNLNLSIRF